MTDHFPSRTAGVKGENQMRNLVNYAVAGALAVGAAGAAGAAEMKKVAI